MGKRVCPWWVGYFLLAPWRRWAHDPAKILAPFVREGMTVLEPGPGMGFFTVELARRVGESGRVIAVDVQEKMLLGLRRRLEREGLLHRVRTILASKDSMNLPQELRVDFTLAFYVVHEVDDSAKFFEEIARVSKPDSQMLVSEPIGHVRSKIFAKELQYAEDAGFSVSAPMKLRRTHTAVLRMSEAGAKQTSGG